MIGHSSELIVFDWQFLHIHDLVYEITDKISARPVEVIENCRLKLKYTMNNIDNCRRLLVIFLFRPFSKNLTFDLSAGRLCQRVRRRIGGRGGV